MYMMGIQTSVIIIMYAYENTFQCLTVCLSMTCFKHFNHDQPKIVRLINVFCVIFV